MNDYFIDIDLPHHFDQTFMALIPEQRAFINKMMNKGVISSYSLSMDRTKLWVTIKANTESEVEKLFGEFPLYEYMHGAIIPLMFHQGVNVALPQPSLN